MATLDPEWENMGGRVIRKKVDGSTVGSQGDTIVHPLKGPFSGASGRIGWRRERWTNKAVGDFPSNFGARIGSNSNDTLAAALANATIP